MLVGLAWGPRRVAEPRIGVSDTSVHSGTPVATTCRRRRKPSPCGKPLYLLEGTLAAECSHYELSRRFGTMQ